MTGLILVVAIFAPVLAPILAAILEAIFGVKGQPRPMKPPRPPRTPQQINIIRACVSSGLLVACAVVAFLATLIGMTPDLIAEFLRDPRNPPAPLVVWTAAVVIGVAYLTVGLRGAYDGPHAGLWAFWSAVVPIVGGVVMWLHAPWLLHDPFVIGGCLVVAVVCGVRFWIAMSSGGKAQRNVRRHIGQQGVAWRSARRR